MFYYTEKKYIYGKYEKNNPPDTVYINQVSSVRNNNAIEIAVVIITRNKSNLIVNTLESILMQTEKVEIIVVNDCSEDNTLEVLSNYDITVLTPQIHFNSRSYARNCALQFIDNREYCWIYDDDIVLSNKNIAKELLNIAKKNTIAVCRRMPGKNEVWKMTAPHQNINELKYKWIHCGCGCNLILLKNIKEIFYFDERYKGWGFEDNDLNFRLMQFKNMDLYCLSNDVGYGVHQSHFVDRNMNEQYKKNWQLLRNKIEKVAPSILSYSYIVKLDLRCKLNKKL